MTPTCLRWRGLPPCRALCLRWPLHHLPAGAPCCRQGSACAALALQAGHAVSESFCLHCCSPQPSMGYAATI